MRSVNAPETLTQNQALAAFCEMIGHAHDKLLRDFHTMTVHFAAARCASASPLARVFSRRRVGTPANDNGGTNNDDVLLRAALKHFAKHGLNAALDAQSMAEDAFFAGDRQGYDHWLGVCRSLDRRLADALQKRRSNA